MFIKGNKLGKANKGRTISPEWRKKMSISHLGHKASIETKLKMSKIRKGKPSKKKGTKQPLWWREKNRQGQFRRHSKDNQNYIPYEWASLRELRLKVQGGSHTSGEWEILKAQYNWTCPSCREIEPKIKLTRDHIVPVSKGGSDNIENLQPLCRKCNSKKHTQIVKYDY